MSEPHLRIYVIYDFPLHYIAVCQLVGEGGKLSFDPHFQMINSDIEQIRHMLRSIGLVHMDRSPEDTPEIVETWI